MQSQPQCLPADDDADESVDGDDDAKLARIIRIQIMHVYLYIFTEILIKLILMYTR